MSGAHQRSVILGTGSELPAKVITNQDLERMVETSDEWITVRTGIKQRRVLEEGKGNADMAYHAAAGVRFTIVSQDERHCRYRQEVTLQHPSASRCHRSCSTIPHHGMDLRRED